VAAETVKTVTGAGCGLDQCSINLHIGVAIVGVVHHLPMVGQTLPLHMLLEKATTAYRKGCNDGMADGTADDTAHGAALQIHYEKLSYSPPCPALSSQNICVWPRCGAVHR
jgi:hypothetical protein